MASPKMHVLPSDTPPVLSGFNYFRTNTREYTEPTYVEVDSPTIRVISGNAVNEEDLNSLMLIGSVSAAEIKVAYESNLDTNAYTDSDRDIVLNTEQNLSDEAQLRANADIVLQNLILNYITTISGAIPTQLSQLSDDADHRLVTDIEKDFWNDKIGTSDVINGGVF